MVTPPYVPNKDELNVDDEITRTVIYNKKKLVHNNIDFLISGGGGGTFDGKLHKYHKFHEQACSLIRWVKNFEH